MKTDSSVDCKYKKREQKWVMQNDTTPTPKSALQLARVLIKQGDHRFDDAELVLKKAAEDHPEQPHVWTELGKFYIRREEFRKAKECYKAAMKIEPSSTKNGGYMIILTGILIELEDYEETVALIKDSSKYKLTSKEKCHAYVFGGKAYFGLGIFPKAQ